MRVVARITNLIGDENKDLPMFQLKLTQPMQICLKIVQLFKMSLEKNDFPVFPTCNEHYIGMQNFEGCNVFD